MMSSGIRTVLIVASVCSALWTQQSATTPPQTVTSKDRSGTPVLRLELIPNKRNYGMNETVLTKTTFTNLSDTVLCFPKPEQGRQLPLQGYLAVQTAGPPSPKEYEYFLEHIDSRGPWPREKLLLEIEHDWIKLSPSETYTTASAPVTAILDVPGQWRLTETYLPPEGSFGGDAYRNYLTSAAKSAGCVLPVTEVSAETVVITVADKPEE
jgi:hypothetical protein